VASPVITRLVEFYLTRSEPFDVFLESVLIVEDDRLVVSEEMIGSSFAQNVIPERPAGSRIGQPSPEEDDPIGITQKFRTATLHRLGPD